MAELPLFAGSTWLFTSSAYNALTANLAPTFIILSPKPGVELIAGTASAGANMRAGPVEKVGKKVVRNLSSNGSLLMPSPR
jgi:hypothetical protein